MMWLSIGLLFLTMCGLIVAAVEMWHLLHLNEDVKKSKTKTALCWTGFGVCVALATVCAVLLLLSLSKKKQTNGAEENAALLGSTQDTLKTYSHLLSPEEKEAMLYEIEQSKFEMQKRLVEIQGLLPEVYGQIRIIDQNREKIINDTTKKFVPSDPSYQELLAEKEKWQAYLNELMEEQEQLIAALSPS